MAKPHGDHVLHKYVGLYAANLIKVGTCCIRINCSGKSNINSFFQENKCLEAAELYYKHGTPAYPQNYNLYRRIVMDTFSGRNLDTAESYIHWARLRTILHNLVRWR